jgi:putative phosphoribosyl transferase
MRASTRVQREDPMRFRDRRDAGHRLAELLVAWRRERPVVVGLSRGGVPVAAEVASGLQAPLDVVVVRKLGHPRQPELGVGAIGEGGVAVVNWEFAERLGVTSGDLHQVVAREQGELDRLVVRYRGTRPRIPVEDRLVILVDDGLATGFTARAAVEALRRSGARRVVLAVPVAPADTVDELRAVADDVVCLAAPPWFGSVGEWYDDFRQVSDEDVAHFLGRRRARSPLPNAVANLATEWFTGHFARENAARSHRTSA